MLGFQSLSFLPLLASLVLSPARTWAAEEATHPDLFQLKPANFEKEISKGHWFVEHFSPWCIHCKHFMPTWLKLVHQAEEELPEVRLAQINCMEYGDLCDKNGIKGYPTVLLFEDGKIIEKYKGARELPDLMAYLKEHVHKEDAHDEHDEPHPDHHDPSDDIPAPPAPPPSTAHLNPDGEVMILDKKTFAKTLEDGPAFVKFYAPWCGHCKKLAPIWTSLAMLMKGKTQIAEVNCDDEGNLCKSQGISGYPTLVYFSGGARSEYSGGRKLEQLKSFAEKASADALEPIPSLSELTSHIHDEPVVYALLYATSSSSILPSIRSASTILLGHPKIYTSPLTSSSRSSFLTQYPTAKHAPYTLLAFKDGNSDTPTAVLPGKEGLSVEDVREWLLKNKLPSWLELTQDSFQSVMNAPSSPLVVVVPSNDKLEDKIEDKVKEMARAWREKTKGTGHAKGGKEVVWAYMDGERWRDWMKSMYGLTIDDDESQLSNVRVVVASHKDLIYYDTDPAGAQLTLGAPTAVYNALNAIAAGSLGYKHSENVVERVARGLNGKITALEEWVVEHPFRFVFFLVGGIALVFWALYKWIGNDAAQLERGDYYMKSKNGRLD